MCLPKIISVESSVHSAHKKQPAAEIEIEILRFEFPYLAKQLPRYFLHDKLHCTTDIFFCGVGMCAEAQGPQCVFRADLFRETQTHCLLTTAVFFSTQAPTTDGYDW